MRRSRQVLFVAVLGIFLNSTAVSGTAGSPSRSDETWTAVGISIADEGAAAFSWDPAPGNPMSYTAILEIEDVRFSVTVGSSARTTYVQMAEDARHQAKLAWLVANYESGHSIRSDSTLRDAVEPDEPAMIVDCPDFFQECPL
jgi:hypothetical protein